MRWSEPHLHGFLLAATLASDRGARQAASGLTPDARPDVEAAGEALEGLDSAQRRRRIAALVARFRLPSGATAPHWPARSQALWATGLPPEQARSLLATAPAARAGFVPEPGLMQLVRRIAASPGAR
jgi:hypothetical protein